MKHDLRSFLGGCEAKSSWPRVADHSRLPLGKLLALSITYQFLLFDVFVFKNSKNSHWEFQKTSTNLTSDKHLALPRRPSTKWCQRRGMPTSNASGRNLMPTPRTCSTLLLMVKECKSSCFAWPTAKKKSKGSRQLLFQGLSATPPRPTYRPATTGQAAPCGSLRKRRKEARPIPGQVGHELKFLLQKNSEEYSAGALYV